MTPHESALAFWTLVRELQVAADGHHLDHRAWVADEQLDELLQRPDQSDLAPEVVAKLRRLTQNRAKKYFYQQHGRAEYYRTHPDQIDDGQCDEIDTRDDLAALAKYVPLSDYALLWHVADKVEYKGIAEEFGCPVGTVKARVGRAREAIRNHSSQLVERLLVSSGDRTR